MDAKTGGWRSDEWEIGYEHNLWICPDKILANYKKGDGNITKKKPGRHQNDQVIKVTINSNGTSQYHVLLDVVHWEHSSSSVILAKKARPSCDHEETVSRPRLRNILQVVQPILLKTTKDKKDCGTCTDETLQIYDKYTHHMFLNVILDQKGKKRNH